MSSRKDSNTHLKERYGTYSVIFSRAPLEKNVRRIYVIIGITGKWEFVWATYLVSPPWTIGGWQMICLRKQNLEVPWFKNFR